MIDSKGIKNTETVFAHTSVDEYYDYDCDYYLLPPASSVSKVHPPKVHGKPELLEQVAAASTSGTLEHRRRSAVLIVLIFNETSLTDCFDRMFCTIIIKIKSRFGNTRTTNECAPVFDHICVFIRAYMNSNINTCIYVCTHIYTHTCVYIYVYINT